jgi:hypothetical protein
MIDKRYSAQVFLLSDEFTKSYTDRAKSDDASSA